MEVHYTASSMRQYDEDKQNLERRGGNHEEVDRGHLLYMIGQEGSPGLRRRLAVPPQILGHCRLRHLDPQLGQFPVKCGMLSTKPDTVETANLSAPPQLNFRGRCT